MVWCYFAILKKLEGLGQNLSFQSVHSVYGLTGLAGNFLTNGTRPNSCPQT